MSRYAKAIAALLTALGTWGATAGADGRYDGVELWALTGVLVTALAVFAIPNEPPPEPLPVAPSLPDTAPTTAAPAKVRRTQ